MLIELIKKRRVRQLKEGFYAEISNLQQACTRNDDSLEIQERIERIKRLFVKLCKYVN